FSANSLIGLNHSLYSIPILLITSTYFKEPSWMTP
ncbi:hypothetical protein TNCT_19951, partial [Trichonephila clavata]